MREVGESSAPAAASGRRRSPFARLAWFGAALVLFSVSSFRAFRQEPRPDAYRRPSPLTADWWRHPIERNAPARLPLVWGNLNDVFALRGKDAGKVWAVGEGGLVLHSDDYGRHWTRQYLVRPAVPAGRPAAAAWLRELAPSDPLAALTLLGLTTNPNPPIGPPVPEDLAKAPLPPALADIAHSTLWSIQLIDDRYGWVAGDGGALFATTNGGESWERRDAQVGTAAIYLVDFSNRSNGTLSTRSGLSRFTSDGGRSWRQGTLRLTHFAGHFDLSNILLEPGSRVRSYAYADPSHQWVVGDSGLLLATEDGGATWSRQSRKVPALGANAVANAAAIAQEQGKYGPYSIWPAPWYGLSLLVTGLLLVPAFKTPPAEVDPSPSVAGLLISDRPIERGEADVFDFSAVALGLSRFLRNEKTEPPLTIAITGEWGSGKSSLMNLLRGDLRRYGFRPVWFNAWHHQKEDNLLASLLEAVRAQAIPSVWRPEGMIYRARLLGIRWRRYWPVVALLLLAFSVSFGYLRSDPGRTDQAQKVVDAWGTRVTSVLGVLAGHAAEAPKAAPASPSGGQGALSTAQPAPPSEHVPVAGLLLSALGLAVSVWKGAKGFGVDPASLLARDSGRRRDLQALTGFRQRFAAEFGDVTRALNPRTMLILIDDLDRCRPENVIEVLEAVNFLVSSGDCFVVLGMARDRVMRCVGLSFKDVADELLDPVAPPAAAPAPSPTASAPPASAAPSPGGPAANAADLARQRRLEFGQQYLEKLFNIEVPVPVPTDAQSRRLLAASEPPEETPEERRRERRRELWTGARKVLPAAGFAALLAAGFYYGLTRPPEPPAPVVPPPVTKALVPAILGVPAVMPALVRQVPEPTLGDPVHWTHWPLTVLALLLLGLGAWRLSIPPDVVIRDSQEFEQALAAWHPLLFAWRNTPRSIKRYLNRVRYLAMLQRAPAPEPALWQRWIDSLARLWRRARKRPEPAAASRPAKSERSFIPEDFLVALSAIDCCRPELLRDPQPLRSCLRTASPKLPESLGKLVDNPQWARTLESFRGRYLEMASGIHVS